MDKCALKRVSVLINLRSTTQLNTIVPWLKRPKLYTLCEKREGERKDRFIQTRKVRRTPDRRIMQSKRSLTSTSPLSFFSPFPKRRRQNLTLWTPRKHTTSLFDFSPFLLGLHFIPTKETETLNKWFYVFHIFFGVCIRKRSTPVWWSSVSVVLTPRCMCV